MKISTSLLKAAIAIAFLAPTLASPPTSQFVRQVSMIRLPPAPRDLDGVLIATMGYWHTGSLGE